MLIIFTVLMAVVCLIVYFNEKVTKLPHEIALLLFSAVIGFFGLFADVIITGNTAVDVLMETEVLDALDIQDFLMEGVLCLMLFAGSVHLKLTEFRKLARQVTVL